MYTMDPRVCAMMFKRLKARNPKPTTELQYHSPFELLIAVVLSAQATDVSVNKATRELFAVATTPEAMLQLGETALKRYIRHIGLFNSKARNILATCALLCDRHGGRVPDDRKALEGLPGVGRKTANVILNTAFRQPTIAVDTHVFRVASRTGLARGKTPLAVEQCLNDVIPARYRQDAHHWLILHGRYVCTARNPRCAECPIADLCTWPAKTAQPARIPTVGG